MSHISRLTWEARNYEAGLDRGVFYPSTGPGEAWNGLTSVAERTSETDEQVRYVDGRKIQNARRTGYFEGTIEAFTYPESFYQDILLQKRHPTFGLSYRVTGGDTYKLHLVYNVLLSPGQQVYQQGGTEPFSWDFTSLPISVPTVRRSAHLIVESSIAYSWTVAALEDVLYGTDVEDPRLPLPEEVLEIFEENSILQIIDHGDGTWTAIGPDEVVYMLDATTFEINWPSAVYISADTYTVSSL